MKKARAYFQIIPVGSTRPRLLAVGGENEIMALDTSEWWEEEEDSWEEGPTLSRGRSDFAALMAPPHLVCSETIQDSNDTSSPGSVAPSMESHPTG